MAKELMIAVAYTYVNVLLLYLDIFIRSIFFLIL
jgi:hypothetical protein